MGCRGSWLWAEHEILDYQETNSDCHSQTNRPEGVKVAKIKAKRREAARARRIATEDVMESLGLKRVKVNRENILRMSRSLDAWKHRMDMAGTYRPTGEFTDSERRKPDGKAENCGGARPWSSRSKGPRSSGETLQNVGQIHHSGDEYGRQGIPDQPTSTLIALPRTRMVNQAVVKFLEQEERLERVVRGTGNNWKTRKGSSK